MPTKRRNQRQWRLMQEWMGSPRGVSMLITFAAIWALTGFNPWVAFGLSLGALGTARKFAENRRNEEIDEILDLADKYQKGELDLSTNDDIKPTPISTLSNELHKKVIEDARGDLLQIKAASTVASGELGVNLHKIVKNAEDIERDLLKEPHKLSQVQRIFTYYIPATQDLLLARGKALASQDNIKLSEVDNMMARLAIAFEDFARKMHGEDARSIDIDIRLLEQSLAQDLNFEIRQKDKS